MSAEVIPEHIRADRSARYGRTRPMSDLEAAIRLAEAQITDWMEIIDE